MATRWAISSGDNNQTSTWNDGATLGLPTSADDVFTNGFTVNMVANATYISMNNSARSRDIATPLMTGYTTPQGTAISSGDNGLSAAWRAFNRNTTSATDQRWQSTTNNAGWVGFQFNNGLTAKVINQYLIYGSTTLANNPNTWTFEGSNDNVTWAVLHTVTGTTVGASSTYSSPLLANTTSYEYYRINVTAVGTAGNTIIIPEIEFYERFTAALASGGSFNFNTSGVTVSATSTSASLSAGATNLITVTATTGTVTLSLGSAVTGPAINSSNLINHSGNCNFNLNGTTFNSVNTVSVSGTSCILKSSTGTITIVGNLEGSTGGNQGNLPVLTSTAGNTIITGNVVGGIIGSQTINQSAGNITITGNVTGGRATSIFAINLSGAASQFTINGDVRGGSGSSAFGINFGGTLGTVNGNVTGGSGTLAAGINTTTGGVNVTGNVTGFVGAGIGVAANSTIIGNLFGGSGQPAIGNPNNNSFTVTVTGDVYASTTQNGIALTGTGTQVVNLTGNMYNTLGRMAIWCPNVFISNTATTLWRMDTGGGNYKFLYSADYTPNLPATTNVRNGVTFGPALSLTGTMVVPSASDVRENVPVDNTAGTGELTSADIISGINASSNDLAVRLKNTLTDVTAGNIISQYNNS